MSRWITVIEDGVRTKLKAVEVFIRTREMRFLAQHNAGVQTDPTDVKLQGTEAMTNTNTRLNIDTVER